MSMGGDIMEEMYERDIIPPLKRKIETLKHENEILRERMEEILRSYKGEILVDKMTELLKK